jgi:hypothetical protein
VNDKEQHDLIKLIADNEFNKLFFKHFHVNPNKEVVIKGIRPRIILSEEEQTELIQEIHNLTIKKAIGEEPSCLEKIALKIMLEGTY